MSPPPLSPPMARLVPLLSLSMRWHYGGGSSVVLQPRWNERLAADPAPHPCVRPLLRQPPGLL